MLRLGVIGLPSFGHRSSSCGRNCIDNLCKKHWVKLAMRNCLAGCIQSHGAPYLDLFHQQPQISSLCCSRWSACLTHPNLLLSALQPATWVSWPFFCPLSVSAWKTILTYLLLFDRGSVLSDSKRLSDLFFWKWRYTNFRVELQWDILPVLFLPESSGTYVVHRPNQPNVSYHKRCLLWWALEKRSVLPTNGKQLFWTGRSIEKGVI